MATGYVFNGKNRTLPGVYTNIESAITNPIRTATYGVLCLIDTGNDGATWGGGAGIDGELESGKDAIYEIDNLKDYKSFVKGGKFWDIGNALFQPDGFASVGISKILMVKAATTVAAELEMKFGDDDSDSSDSDTTLDGGTLQLQVRNEGVIGNGLLSGTNLYKGYSCKMFAGEIDSSKYIFRFYIGTWRGLDADGDNYDNIAQADAIPLMLVESPEVDDIQELIDWMEADSTFQYYFNVKDSVILGTGGIDDEDLGHYSSHNVFSGGTETYSSANITKALEYLQDEYLNFFLCDRYGDEAQGSENGLILSHIVGDDVSYEESMFVGGGVDSSKWTQTNGSIPTAQYFDSESVEVIHGGVKVSSNVSGLGYKVKDQFYHAALVAGRTLGLPPQVPSTGKGLNVIGLQHPLKKSEQRQALDNGVTVTIYDNEVSRFIILQGVTTIQKNTNFINEDATTFSMQIKRIKMQLNNEIKINVRRDLFNTENGVNRFTLSTKNLRDYIRSYLKTRTVTETDDNLLIDFGSVTATREEDNLIARYEGEPNGEITKAFITGVFID